MAEFPALPIFTDAYLADTRHLTTEEHGAYLLLLMCAWRTRGCALKDDDRFLARTVGVSPRKWRNMRSVLADFFIVQGGLWKQKKLLDVYENVAAKVAKNRANGAKGGRAKALKQSSECQSAARAKPIATKTRIQNPKESSSPECQPPAADYKVKTSPDGFELSPEQRASIAVAACLEEKNVDFSPCYCWLAADVDLDADIFPVLRRISAREMKRKGRPPATLSYYDAAILEARDKRVKATKTGVAHAANYPSAARKRRFNPDSVTDWQAFLGDPASRFRGEYLSRHWRIGSDHPFFMSTGLGPDPRVRENPAIPDEVMAVYGENWGWVQQRQQSEKHQNNENMQTKGNQKT